MPEHPTGQLRPYQINGSEWVIQRLSTPDTRAVLLCDDPGLGKSVQALCAAHRLGVRRMIIAAPAGARRVWSQEIARWFPDWSRHVLIIEPGSRLAECQARFKDEDLIVLIAYDALSNLNMPVSWGTALSLHSWDLLVLDEAHYLKNASNRTKAVYGERGNTTGLHTACKSVLLLTGTPTPNHAGELYHHIRTLWPGILRRPNRDVRPDQPAWRTMTEAEFQEQVTEYRDTRWGRQIVRSKNQDWLRDRLKDVVLHRSKTKVLPELPAVIAQDVPLAVSPRELREALDSQTDRLSQALVYNTHDLPDDEFLAVLRRAEAQDLGNLARLRRQLGEVKVEQAVEWITERLSCGIRKIIVFGWHVSVLEHIHRRLRDFDPVLITGATSPNGRTNAIELFQTRPSVRVFVGQIIAAGTAITLTAASEVVIAEPSWVPGENRQAIDRAHRLGQRDTVIASFLYIPGTLDERIMQTFRRKAADVAPIIQEAGELEHAG